MSFYQYLLESKNQIAFLLVEHIQLTVVAVLLAILLGVPLGILISYVQRLCKVVLGSVNVIQAVPSLALLGLAIPLLGIGKLPAVIVVMLYSLLPIVKNTNTGLTNINPDTIEAAQGIGLTGFQILTKVQIPLALPVIMAGVRIAAVTAVGLMTIAAFIGAGGLGFLVFSGISTVNNNLIVAGAVPACILALVVDFVVGQIEKKVSPSYAVEKEDEKKSWILRGPVCRWSRCATADCNSWLFKLYRNGHIQEHSSGRGQGLYRTAYYDSFACRTDGSYP